MAIQNNPHKDEIGKRDKFAERRSEIQDRFVATEKQQQVLEDQRKKAVTGIAALQDELLRIQGEFRLLEEMAKAEHQAQREK